MQQRVGTCSLCGGDVFGHRGPWLSVTPPPPDKCGVCGAVARKDVIEMQRPEQPNQSGKQLLNEQWTRTDGTG